MTYIREPQRYEIQGQVRQLRLICHPELRGGIGAWAFRMEEGNSLDNKKKRCLKTEIDPQT